VSRGKGKRLAARRRAAARVKNADRAEILAQLIAEHNAVAAKTAARRRLSWRDYSMLRGQ